MIRRLIELLHDIRIVKQHPREFHSLHYLAPKRCFIQAHVTGDNGIFHRSIEHPRGKRLLRIQDGAHDEEIQQKLHLQAVPNLGQEKGRCPRFIVENQIVGMMIHHVQTVDLPAQRERHAVRERKIRQADAVTSAPEADLKPIGMKRRCRRP